MSSQEYIGSNVASASYRPKGYGISPGLQRARRPFRTRNAVTGIAVASFVIGVWAYSISAVKQDIFDDVDEQARVLNAVDVVEPPPPLPISTQHPVEKARMGTEGVRQEIDRVAPPPSQVNHRRGILYSALGASYPWLFEPTHGTFVWGAPPINNIGRLEEKLTAFWRR